MERLKATRSIIIWGAGLSGQIVYDFLGNYNLTSSVQYFADNNTNKWGLVQNGLSVLSADEVVRYIAQHQDTLIIIAAAHVADIERQLISLGINEHNIDIRGYGIARNVNAFQEQTPFEIIHAHFECFEKVYSYLEDTHSKELYVSLLNTKIALDNKYLRGLSSPSASIIVWKIFISFR